MHISEPWLALFKVLLKDPKVTAQAGWEKIVLVGTAGGSTRMAGYSFDAAGAFKPVSPDLDALLLLRQLHQSTKASDPAGQSWRACLLRMARNGAVGLELECADATRWHVTAENLQQRIQEFAAMPV